MFSYYSNRPEEIVEVSGEQIVVVVRSEARGRASGAEVAGQIAHLWTLRDRRAIRFEAFRSREAALAAAAAS
jgi:ketosteroid isomerase-like protein